MTRRSILPSLLVLLSSGSSLAAERLYIANDDHTDYVWQGSEEDSRNAFLNMTSYYLNQAETTASNPSNTRGRFNFDGSFWAWTWQQNKPQSEMDRLRGGSTRAAGPWRATRRASATTAP